MQIIRIDSVGYDPRYYPRESGLEDWVTVARYKEVLKSNPEKADPNNKKARPFPPICVVRATVDKVYKYLLLDGLHRTKAFKQNGLEVIYANIERLPESKWLARATELNADGKRPLSDMDVASVIVRLEGRGYTDEEIARLVDKTPERLERIKVERITKVKSDKSEKLEKPKWSDNGDDGTVLLKAPFKQFTGTNRAADLEQYQSRFNDRNSLQILNAASDLLESDALDLADYKVIEALERVQDAADGYSIY